MTKPSPETLESEKDKLFLTDAELIRRLGVPEATGRAALYMLDRERRAGFPPKQKLWGDRRYWPSVQAWLDTHYGLGKERPAHAPTSASVGDRPAGEIARARDGYTDANGNFRKIVSGLRAGQVRVTGPDGRKWVEDAKPTDPAPWQRKRKLTPRTPPEEPSRT